MPSCCETNRKDPAGARPAFKDYQAWPPQRKTPEEAEAVTKVYALFASKHDIVLEKFRNQVLKKAEAQIQKLKERLSTLGLDLNAETCHIYYQKNFKPIELDYNLCYVRHGKTEGNTEPRIFQGYCDYWENQLNEVGKKQAEEAAKKMEDTLKTFRPDLILCSPLGRAIETGEAFFKNHPEIPCRIEDGAREQQFGSWDSKQLRYMDPEDICHLFYLDQNVLVKSQEPHITGDGKIIESENFVELIFRQAEFLKSVNEADEVKNAKQKENRKANVLIYGHSMAGAAISILLGHGKKCEDGSLGFDGKYIMANATPTMLTAKIPN